MRNIWNKEIISMGALSDDLFAPLVEKVKSLSIDDYKKFSYNHTRYGIVFKFNQLVVLKEDHISLPDMKSDTLMTEGTNTYPIYYEWQHIIDPIVDRIVSEHLTQGGFVNKMMISNIIPGGKMPTHWDEEPTQLLSKRIHVVITSNAQSEFIVNDTVYHFSPGEIFELNNMMPHSVSNMGDSDRVHLIIDYYHKSHLYELLYGRVERDPDEAICELVLANNDVDYSEYPKKTYSAIGIDT
jgi:hypothetical protein